MDIHISEDLAGIVAVDEVRVAVEWLTKYEPVFVCIEAHLTPVSLEPQYVNQWRTALDLETSHASHAVLTLKYAERKAQKHILFDICRNGDNPIPKMSPDGPHFRWMGTLKSDVEDDQRVIAKVLEKQT